MERSVCTGWSLAIALTLVFIVLQITGVICWTWFWILSPLIFIMIIDVILSIILIIFYFNFKK